MTNPDLQFCNHGFAVCCIPMTDTGKDWIMDNIDNDDDTMWPVYIEHRYLADIVLGARADGLICEG